MLGLFTGFGGIATGIALWAITWLFVWLMTKGDGPFIFDARGEQGAFEKLLIVYLDLAKFVRDFSIATGIYSALVECRVV